MRDRRREGGFTYIELLATAVIILILASAAVPIYRWDQKRRYERWLKVDLGLMRGAIDSYKHLCDEKKILEQDVDQKCYPLTLEELVEGVEIHSQDADEVKKMRFLRRIPVDPFTGEEEWGKRSYQDDWDAESWGGENLYDIHSLAPGRALDGTYYRDW